MNKAVELARKKARKAIESTYKGLCTIYEYEGYRDPETEEKKSKLVLIYQDQPCKLSKKTITSTSDSDIASTIKYTPVLSIAPETEIKAGSKIVVTQHGVTREFKSSGEPFVYETHQEIVLQRDGKA